MNLSIDYIANKLNISKELRDTLASNSGKSTQLFQSDSDKLEKGKSFIVFVRLKTKAFDYPGSMELNIFNTKGKSEIVKAFSEDYITKFANDNGYEFKPFTNDKGHIAIFILTTDNYLESEQEELTEPINKLAKEETNSSEIIINNNVIEQDNEQLESLPLETSESNDNESLIEDLETNETINLDESNKDKEVDEDDDITLVDDYS